MEIYASLMYAGLDRDRFEELLPEAQKENGHHLAIYSSMMSVIFAVCFLVSILAGGKLVINRPIYVIMIVVGFGLYLCSKLILPRHRAFSTILAVVFIIAMYGYSFTVSLLHADMQGVAAVAILLVMPCLFDYRPVYMIVMTIAAQIVYCLLSAKLKEPAIALLDLWNCLFFGSIAVLLSVFQMRVKFRLFQQMRENRYLSETDLLTGAKNRNCFEKRRDRYGLDCSENVCCLYMDANGLHEINDVSGHSSGDRMLQTVANTAIQSFGEENTYRIGGDEFVVLCMDTTPDKINSLVSDIINKVSEAGYSVSTGIAFQHKPEVNMRQLVKEAEACMYDEKQRYYAQGSHDRRRRTAEAQ